VASQTFVEKDTDQKLPQARVYIDEGTQDQVYAFMHEVHVQHFANATRFLIQEGLLRQTELSRRRERARKNRRSRDPKKLPDGRQPEGSKR
jgi:hypothetical protein